MPGAPGVATSARGRRRRLDDCLQSLWRGRARLHHHLDLLCLSGSHAKLARIAFAVVLRHDGIVADGEDMGRQRAGIFLHHVAGRGENAPLRVGESLPARALHKLEGDGSGSVLDRRLGDLAGLDRHVGAHRGVGVAIETDDVVGACVEADHKAGLGILYNLAPVAELILVVGENVEADARLRQTHAAYEHGRELEPSSIEDEGFFQRPAALDLDLPGEVGEAIGRVHEIFTGRQCRCRHRVAMHADELADPVMSRTRREHAPDQSSLELRAGLGQQRLEGHGHGRR